MKIIVQDEHLGRFEWHTPSNLDRVFAEISDMAKNKLRLSEQDVALVEKEQLNELEKLLGQFLHLIMGVYLIRGPESLIITEYVRKTLANLAKESMELAEFHIQRLQTRKKS